MYHYQFTTEKEISGCYDCPCFRKNWDAPFNDFYIFCGINPSHGFHGGSVSDRRYDRTLEHWYENCPLERVSK